MQLRTDLVIQAFPQYAVDVTLRPDGLILLTLSKDDKTLHSRAVSVQSMLSPESVAELIAQLRWGIKAAEDNADWRDEYAAIGRAELPTYTGTPVYFRALQTLVSRRVLKQAS
jgi:hypothetical protein